MSWIVKLKKHEKNLHIMELINVQCDKRINQKYVDEMLT